jgi:AdoMet-dependent rRNA methyltransferase SPB1
MHELILILQLADPTPNNEAKVFKPEIKKRKREGYEEGDWTQFKSAPVSEFIQTADPIAMLGSLNQLSFQQVICCLLTQHLSLTNVL